LQKVRLDLARPREMAELRPVAKLQ